MFKIKAIFMLVLAIVMGVVCGKTLAEQGDRISIDGKSVAEYVEEGTNAAVKCIEDGTVFVFNILSSN